MANASSKDTTVSKASPAVKSIVATCFPSWRGRKVSVREVGPDWCHVQYQDDDPNTRAWHVRGGGIALFQGRTDGKALIHRPQADAVLAIWQRFLGDDMGVELVIPAGAVDQAALEIAVDALLSGRRKDAGRALEACGVFAGIAMALAEAQVKALRAGEAKAAA